MMKLSEAILLGSVGTEQGYGCKAILPNGKATCALGAALFAVGDRFSDWVAGVPRVCCQWPWAQRMVQIPDVLQEQCHEQGFGGVVPVVSMIWRLNDIAKWTRPQIAAWVAELGKTYDPDPVLVEAPGQDAVEVQ